MGCVDEPQWAFKARDCSYICLFYFNYAVTYGFEKLSQCVQCLFSEIRGAKLFL